MLLHILKEVAEIVCAKTPVSNYMATFLQTFFEISYVIDVPNTSFNPVPQVDVAIVVLKTLEEQVIQPEEVEKYSKFLHHGFSQQRKMLNKRFDVKLLEDVGIDQTRRAESLSIEEWLKLFRKA